MTVRSSDRARRTVLPSLSAHVCYAASLLGDSTPRIGLFCLPGPQEVQGGVDRSRQGRVIQRPYELKERHALQQASYDAAMERRQRQITNELVLEGQNANKIALFFSNGNPEEVEIGNRTNHVLWGTPRLGVSQLFEIIRHH